MSKTRTALRNSGLLLFALSLSLYAQTRETTKSLPKLLTLREQMAVRENWLRKRLDTMLLPMMRRNNIPVGSSRVDLQACKLEYSIVSPK